MGWISYLSGGRVTHFFSLLGFLSHPLLGSVLNFSRTLLATLQCIWCHFFPKWWGWEWGHKYERKVTQRSRLPSFDSLDLIIFIWIIISCFPKNFELYPHLLSITAYYAHIYCYLSSSFLVLLSPIPIWVGLRNRICLGSITFLSGNLNVVPDSGQFSSHCPSNSKSEITVSWFRIRREMWTNPRLWKRPVIGLETTFKTAPFHYTLVPGSTPAASPVRLFLSPKVFWNVGTLG